MKSLLELPEFVTAPLMYSKVTQFVGLFIASLEGKQLQMKGPYDLN